MKGTSFEFCGDCGAHVGATKFCPKCGGKLASSGGSGNGAGDRWVPTKTAIARTSSAISFCGECGATLAPRTKFCSECGVPVKDEVLGRTSVPQDSQAALAGTSARPREVTTSDAVITHTEELVEAARAGVKTISIGVTLGLTLYVVSFFLTAVQDGTTPLEGWWCAVEALLMPLASNDWIAHGGRDIRLFVAGLTNLCFLGYILLRYLSKLQGLRTGFAVAVLFCIADTWLVLAGATLQIKLGHVMWIAGMFTILAPELDTWNVTLQGRPR